MPFVIKAKSHNQEWTVKASMPGPSLLDYLQSNEVPIRSSCMGKGICHQCRVQVNSGVAPVSGADRKTFSEENLKQGWRLSCCIRPKANIEVFFPQIYQFGEQLQITREASGPWWVACDLGTTGLELVGMDEQGEWGRIKAVNRQISMGADVMTRLEYAQKNSVLPLNKRIHMQLKNLINSLIKNAGTNGEFNKEVIVAGNSAVTAFLANQDISQLAVAPYQPVTLEGVEVSAGDIKYQTLPLIHSFVGGDLFAGLFLLWKQGLAKTESWILIDVGTNSEILFWDTNKLFVSSTPAGPAFEGSSISIGMRAENGAIINPKWQSDKSEWSYDVIGNDFPRGICGSALIEFFAEAVAAGFISKDGEVLDEEKLKLTPELEIIQDDVREFQLAKSAILTGLELVASESQVTPKKLYIGGAFGSHLKLESCFALGMFPEYPVEILGNTSVTGTMLWGQATQVEREDFQSWLSQVKTPIELALRDQFQSEFVKNMNF